MKLIAATALAGLLASPLAADCFERDHLAAYLQVEHGLKLRSWGLNDSGNMVELFLSDRSHWAVVETTPARCASVRMPHKEWGRLSDPVQPNKAVPAPRYMTQGSAL